MGIENSFLNENFLLKTTLAQELFHNYAKDAPIIDFHCHLPAKEIFLDQPFEDISQLWLGGDHYKWRLMRANGVDEAFITGGASNWEKFAAWAATMPQALGNPVYLWSHLELARIFHLPARPLSPSTARATYDACNLRLAQNPMRPSDLFRQFNVHYICTTDDPSDDLAYHLKMAQDPLAPAIVVPTFRPDQAFNTGDRPSFLRWLALLGDISGKKINSYGDLIDCLGRRAEFFHAAGCRIADHGLEKPEYCSSTLDEIEIIFSRLITDQEIQAEETAQYHTQLLVDLSKIYFSLDWAMQLHFGALRNVNSAMYNHLGKDSGYDIIGDSLSVRPLTRLLDRLNAASQMPKTIFYCLNPNDYDMIATSMGAFQQGTVPSRLQLGAAWWFNDHTAGITRQLTALANHGLLGRFIGMLTDSRSFLSYPRHEYFRRILCNLLGSWAAAGEIPDDLNSLGDFVQNICYKNGENYFRIPRGERLA